METKDDFGEKLIEALEEAGEHHEGRLLSARADRVEITPPASELRGMPEGMNTDYEREEDRY